MTEPRPWPKGVWVPPPRQTGGLGWFIQYRAPGESQLSASLAEGLTKDDVQRLISDLQKQKFRLYQVKPMTRVQGEPGTVPRLAPAALAPQTPAKAETPQTGPTAPFASGQIEEPDPADPIRHRWVIRYRMKSGFENGLSPDLTGTEALAMRRRLQAMGLTIVEMWKRGALPSPVAPEPKPQASVAPAATAAAAAGSAKPRDTTTVSLVIWAMVVGSGGLSIYLGRDLLSNMASEHPFAIIATLCASVIVLGWAASTACPSCRKWLSCRTLKTEVVDRTGSYSTVVRYDEQFNARGENVGHTQRLEQVHVTRETERTHYECSGCGHKWDALSTRQFEG